MILDGFLTWSINQAVTVTAVSTNIIDLGVISGVPSSAQGGGARDIGIGDDPYSNRQYQLEATATRLK